MDLDTAVALAGARHQGLACTRHLIALGVSASSLSRAVGSGRLVRHARGVVGALPLPPLPRHLVTDRGPDPAFVVRVRVVLLARPAVVAAGRTAAALRGWELLVEPRQPEVAVRHGSRRMASCGPAAWQARSLRVEDVEVLPGTAPLASLAALDVVLGAAVRLPRMEAVVLADSALRAGAVQLDDLLHAADRPRRVEAARVRRVLALCDPASGSVLESVLRVQLVTAGLTGFVTQQVLRDRHGRHVLRADFCFPDARVVVEVDGRRWHQEPRRDRTVDNALAALGWRVLRYGWHDVVHDGSRVVEEVRKAVGCLVGA